MSAASLPKWCGFVTFVGVSYFAECCENRPVTVCEMLINLLKFPIPQWWGKWKVIRNSVFGTGSPSKVNQFFRLGPITTPSFNKIGHFCSNPAHRTNDIKDSCILRDECCISCFINKWCKWRFSMVFSLSLWNNSYVSIKTASSFRCRPSAGDTVSPAYNGLRAFTVAGPMF